MGDEFVPLRNQPLDSLLLNEKFDEYGDNIRQRHCIEIDGNNVPAPIQDFDELPLPQSFVTLLKIIKQFSKPTPIQMQCAPCLIEKRDVIGLSQTGSGKTLAYVLPVCCHLYNKTATANNNCSVSPCCVVVVPTRELMYQVTSVFKEYVQQLFQQQTNSQPNYSNFNNFNCCASGHLNHPPVQFSLPYQHTNSYNHQPIQNRSVCDQIVVGVCGGISIREDISNLNPSTQVLVATPGRLIDLCEKQIVSLSSVEHFFVDECDRLLEMEVGMEEQLRKIVSMVTIHNNAVTTGLFSATLPVSLERIVRSACVNPIYVCTGVQTSVPRNISQNVIFMHSYMKQNRLLEVLRETPFPPVLVFVRSKVNADAITEMLHEEQFHCEAIHSGKDQNTRNDIIKDFKEEKFDILVATDLVSRGIDVPAISHVINYDEPNTIDDYIHRCGRTGRFGRKGTSSTFLTLECKIASQLKQTLEASGSEVPVELNDVTGFGKKVLRTEMGDRIVSC